MKPFALRTGRQYFLEVHIFYVLSLGDSIQPYEVFQNASLHENNKYFSPCFQSNFIREVFIRALNARFVTFCNFFVLLKSCDKVFCLGVKHDAQNFLFYRSHIHWILTLRSIILYTPMSSMSYIMLKLWIWSFSYSEKLPTYSSIFDYDFHYTF